MSTKTTFKRIALVAVAALGLGTVAAVPSSALVASVSSITVGTLTPARVGQPVLIPITINTGAVAAANDTMTINAEISAAPTQGGIANAASVLLTAASNTGNTAAATKLMFADSSGNKINTAENTSQTVTQADGSTAGQTNARYSVGQLVGGLVGRTFTNASNTAVGAAAVSVRYFASGTTDTANTHYVSVTPDLPGTYTILISANVGTNTAYAAGDTSVAVTFTTGSTPASVTLTPINSKTTNGAANGALIKVTLKDAAGAAAQLGTNEVVKVTPSAGSVAKWSQSALVGSQSAFATSQSLSASDFINGAAWVNVKAAASTTAASIVVTAAGSGLLSAAVTSNTTITSNPTADVASPTVTFPSTAAAGVGAKAASTTYSATVGYTVPTTSKSWTIGLASTAATALTEPLYGTLTVTDDSGYLTAAGFAGLKWDLGYSSTLADKGEVGVTITSALALAQGKQFTINHGAEGNHVISGDVAAASAFTVTPAAITSATGGVNSIKALLKDQYGVALANTAVTASVAGRNGATAASALVTDASGYVTYSLTDAGTVGTSDVVTFTVTAATSVTKSVTITYGTVTVGTVAVTGGATADVAPTITYSPIYTGNIGAGTTGAVKFTATVKDAAGNLLSGVPVTFTADSGLIVKTATVDYTTVYTGTDGKAVTYAFDWKTGKQTVTATVGGKTATGYANWSGETNTTARKLAATVSNNVVTFNATDRFGNPVNGVVIALTRTGTGYFASGTSTSSATTDRTGSVSVQFNGSGSVTGTLAATYEEAYDLAGEVAAVALKAAVASTTVGTGASFSAAGVATVTVAVDGVSTTEAASQAAADAAAEATDAANAATDAANAAAEAADAATAAAQDAADAVAALSTQVTELVSALRKQITSLTNLVIKIQKKVRA